MISAKRNVIQNFQKTREATLRLLETIAPEIWNTYTLGRWHLREMIAHIIGWDYWGAKAVQEITLGKQPAYFAFGKDNDWAEVNEKFVREYFREDISGMIALLKDSGEYLVQVAENISEEDFEKDIGIMRKNMIWTVAREITDLFEHEEKHMRKVARYSENT